MSAETGPDFRPGDAGRDPAYWREALEAVGALQLRANADRLVVLSAHPDDETLGAGGLLAAAADAGRRVHLVVATAGEASHPGSPTHTPADLARVRRGELEEALERLAPGAELTWWGLPDGRLAEHEQQVVTGLVDLLGRDGAATVLCAPWRGDGHPDHEAAGRAAAVAAYRCGAQLVEYPIWVWHWGSPEDLPGDDVRRHRLTAEQRGAKRSAMAAHRSQTEPLSTDPADAPILPEQVLAHFAGGEEFYLVTGPDDAALDDLHGREADPWDVGSWYERRKRALTLAALPRERYDAALEVGCSVGALAEDLAGRCGSLLAVDDSPRAVAAARERLAGVAGVEVHRARLPEDWPVRLFGLVVVSEVGYFLSPAGLDGVVAGVEASLVPGGDLVLCHWRHPIEGWPLDAAAVHARFAESRELSPVARYLEDDVELLVLRRR